MTRKILTLTTVALLSVSALAAQIEGQPEVTLESLMQMLQEQQKTLADQQKLIERQSAELEEHREALTALQSQYDHLVLKSGQAPAELTDETVQLRERLAAVEAEVKGRPDESVKQNIAGDFPGSIRIPGTNMSGKVGGFVRLGVVDSLDPIGSDDRFIVGSIPVGDTSASTVDNKGVTISAKRSRVNLDMRMDSSVGKFRAFIEGDFATASGSSDVFRLRHAFGQYKNFILGQTWSTFMDLQAAPEELDFEGLNAYINERKPIFRWNTLKEGKPSFAVAMEDPTPELTGGTGTGDFPDVVARLTAPRKWGHIQASVVLRQLSGQSFSNPDETSSAGAWGASLSGNARLPFWGKNDNLKFQLNAGRGIASYINDTDSVGGLDGVFDPEGKLHALPVFGGYLAYQHYWKRDPFTMFGGKNLLKNLRSTIVYGYTQVDNFDYMDPDSYAKTRRATLNLIWSPISAIDLGFELLWGQRVNFDDESGTARQLQVVTSFYF